MAGKYFSNENDQLASSITLLRYFSNIFETIIKPLFYRREF